MPDQIFLQKSESKYSFKLRRTSSRAHVDSVPKMLEVQQQKKNLSVKSFNKYPL